VTWHGPLALGCVSVLSDDQHDVSLLKNVFSWQLERKGR
jgi:hypothetical protein